MYSEELTNVSTNFHESFSFVISRVSRCRIAKAVNGNEINLSSLASSFAFHTPAFSAIRYTVSFIHEIINAHSKSDIGDHNSVKRIDADMDWGMEEMEGKIVSSLLLNPFSICDDSFFRES
jgi:hypothetical protein